MKVRLQLVLVALAVLFTGTAVGSERFRIEAPVVSVSPVLRTVTDKIPHQRCWDERVRVDRRAGHSSATPQILGAVIGGVTAGALGDNTGHQGVIATAGALLGASVGHDAAHRRSNRSYYSTERRCEVDYELREREVVSGYRVGYQFDN